MGDRGKAAYEHWQSQVLIEGDPQSLFGAFLVTQKGTRPAGRNPSPKNSSLCSAAPDRGTLT